MREKPGWSFGKKIARLGGAPPRPRPGPAPGPGPCPALPCPALPCPALPCPAPSHLTSPHLTSPHPSPTPTPTPTSSPPHQSTVDSRCILCLVSRSVEPELVGDGDGCDGGPDAARGGRGVPAGAGALPRAGLHPHHRGGRRAAHHQERASHRCEQLATSGDWGLLACRPATKQFITLKLILTFQCLATLHDACEFQTESEGLSEHTEEHLVRTIPLQPGQTGYTAGHRENECYEVCVLSAPRSLRATTNDCAFGFCK